MVVGAGWACGGLCFGLLRKKHKVLFHFFRGVNNVIFLGPCSAVIFKAMFLRLEDAHRRFSFFFSFLIAKVFKKERKDCKSR